MGGNLSSVLQGFSVGAPIAGGIIQARGIEAASEAEAQAAQRNARLTELEGAAESARIRKEGREVVSRGRTLIGKSDVQLSGSPLQFLMQQAAETERNALNARVTARNTAELDRARARNVRAAGERQAGVSLLLGATRGVRAGSQFLRRGS